MFNPMFPDDLLQYSYKYFPSYHTSGSELIPVRNSVKSSKHTKKLLKYKLYFDALHNLNGTSSVNNNNLNFQCPNCYVKSYKYISALRRHLTYECGKEEREFVCTLCLKQYKRRDHLQCHIKLKHHCDMVSQNKVWQDFVKHSGGVDAEAILDCPWTAAVMSFWVKILGHPRLLLNCYRSATMMMSFGVKILTSTNLIGPFALFKSKFDLKKKKLNCMFLIPDHYLHGFDPRWLHMYMVLIPDFFSQFVTKTSLF